MTTIISDDQWENVLEGVIVRSSAVTVTMGAQLPASFRDGVFPLIVSPVHSRAPKPFADHIVRTSEPTLSLLRFTYLLSMVAFELEPFSFQIGGNLHFYAASREHFVVGVVGGPLRDRGRGRQEAVEIALDELKRLA